MPVTVTMVGPPVGAELVAVKVKVLVVALVEMNAAVTPLGMPVAARVTLPVKPPVGLTVIVLVLLPPSATFRAAGFAESVKPGTVTVRLIVAVSGARVPEVPVMVTVAGPGVAELLAVTVRVLVVVAGFVLNAAVTPVGKPEAAKVTLPVNPFVGFTVIVLGILLP